MAEPIAPEEKSPDYLFYISVAYLLYFGQPIAWLWQARLPLPQFTAVVTALVAFAAIYVWLMRRVLLIGQRQRRFFRTTASALVGLGVLAAGLTLTCGVDFLGLFIYVSVAAGFALSTRLAVGSIGVIVGATLVAGQVAGGDWPTVGQIAGLDAAIGVGMVATSRLIGLNRELRAARRELARLAVAEERLRIARDLHDLLGHSLSLIAVKSELAGRLLSSDQPRAGVEVHDIEEVARAALHQVRDAVSGYRQPTLVRELESAQQMLSAAGVACHVDNDWPTMPSASETALSWALREGVTNVIRHSNARNCSIRIAEQAHVIRLEVVDDGRASQSDVTGGGSGLAGVAERVAAVGGTWCAGPSAAGFRLAIAVPRTGQAT